MNHILQKVPESFVRKFSGTLKKKTRLKGRDGKLWNVDVEETEAGVLLKNGWVNFVNHYSLKTGEFLVFEYIGDSTFLVKVFRVDGCKIEVLPA